MCFESIMGRLPKLSPQSMECENYFLWNMRPWDRIQIQGMGRNLGQWGNTSLNQQIGMVLLFLANFCIGWNEVGLGVEDRRGHVSPPQCPWVVLCGSRVFILWV